MFRLIESIPSKKAEPIKEWLAKLGQERIEVARKGGHAEKLIDCNKDGFQIRSRIKVKMY